MNVNFHIFNFKVQVQTIDRYYWTVDRVTYFGVPKEDFVLDSGFASTRLTAILIARYCAKLYCSNIGDFVVYTVADVIRQRPVSSSQFMPKTKAVKMKR